jgi:hypothetical protein
VDTYSDVFRDAGGRLARVRLADGRPLRLWFDSGRGDLFAGVGCGSGRFVTRQALLVGNASYRLTTTTYRLKGGRAHRIGRGVVRRHGWIKAAARAGQSSCPGLTPAGWAVPRGSR